MHMMQLLRRLSGDVNKNDYYNLGYPTVDRAMLIILWLHMIVVTIGTAYIVLFDPALTMPGPLSWRILSTGEALWVVALAALATFLPTLLRDRLPNHYFYRILVTLALFTYSYLIVFATGGSIEAHFHFFVIFLLLIAYYDWRLFWIGLVAVALHHGILNYLAPHWVYFYGRNDVSVIAHAIPVVLVAIFSTWIAAEGKKRVTLAAAKNKELEQELRRRIPELGE